MQTLPVNGSDMAYLEVGDRLPPLVCVHGTLGDFRTWSAVLGPLTEAPSRDRGVLAALFSRALGRRQRHYLIAQHVADMIAFIENWMPSRWI